MELDLELDLVTLTKSLMSKELPLVTNLSNLSSLLKDYFKGASWVGFYLVNKTKEELYLGPFQGSVACTLIPKGKGVCGTAYLTKKSQLVEDVNKCNNHIACSSSTQSELVVPIICQEEVVGVIDLDSEHLAYFTNEHEKLLERVADLISPLFEE